MSQITEDDMSQNDDGSYTYIEGRGWRPTQVITEDNMSQNDDGSFTYIEGRGWRPAQVITEDNMSQNDDGQAVTLTIEQQHAIYQLIARVSGNRYDIDALADAVQLSAGDEQQSPRQRMSMLLEDVAERLTIPTPYLEWDGYDHDEEW